MGWRAILAEGRQGAGQAACRDPRAISLGERLLANEGEPTKRALPCITVHTHAMIGRGHRVCMGVRPSWFPMLAMRVPGNIFKAKLATGMAAESASNELVIRIQPKEAIYLKITNKVRVPGLGMQLDTTKLDLQYTSAYKKELPDAYERLLLDVVNGDKRLFIRYDELQAAWDLFTPLLKEIETKKVPPELYPYGSRGPVGAHYLASKYGVRWSDLDEMDE
eukprot:353000-Chlamydomonas_euryale.AAC.26